MGLKDNMYFSRFMRNHVQLGLCINTSVFHSNVFFHSLQAKKRNNICFHSGSLMSKKMSELGGFSFLMLSVTSWR